MLIWEIRRVRHYLSNMGLCSAHITRKLKRFDTELKTIVLKTLKKDIVIESTIDRSKDYTVAIACLSKTRGNPDSACYLMLDSLVQTELNKNALVIFRVDQDDDIVHYQKLVKKYRNLIDICVLVKSPMGARRNFYQGYVDIYEAIKDVNYAWFQIITDDALFTRCKVIDDLQEANELKNKFLITDKSIDVTQDSWFFDENGEKVVISNPPVVDYPCIKKTFLKFVERKFEVIDLFGPNSCVDNYWASIFSSSEFYKVVPAYTRRSPQLRRFVDNKKINDNRRSELIENSSDAYSSQCHAILKQLKASLKNKEFD